MHGFAKPGINSKIPGDVPAPFFIKSPPVFTADYDLEGNLRL